MTKKNGAAVTLLKGRALPVRLVSAGYFRWPSEEKKTCVHFNDVVKFTLGDVDLFSRLLPTGLLKIYF